MAKIHMILQGKGGVGKSVVAALLAQYKAEKGHKTLCIDTDPVNATFHAYQALDVHQIALLEEDEIVPRRFDALVEIIAPSECDVIIDNGASAFVPLTHYLISNQVPAILARMGHELVIHTVVTGGQAHLVIHKSRIFHSKGLNCGGGIHGALKSDPKRFGSRFAIALATKEAA